MMSIFMHNNETIGLLCYAQNARKASHKELQGALIMLC